MSSYTAISGNAGLLFGGGSKKNKTEEVDDDYEPPTDNLLASEGLQRLILEKQELASERDKPLVERNQLVEHLPVLEAKIAQMDELEARLQQYEQDRMDYSQEAAQLHENLEEAKAKWVELHDMVIVIAEHESDFMEQVNNLEAVLRAKIEEANAADEMREKMKEKFKRVMEQNRLHSSNNVELDFRISGMRTENEELQSKIDWIQVKLRDSKDSLVFEKMYSIYHMKGKTLEESKEGIVNIDDCIS
ncbi:uncharacterized protein [Nicotiana tomentosiformis]|uniref:uncharacterized protein n=1 Tax=Nicotiana tomentosiformis TaxID=4098 RepID=UPI00388C978A